MGNTQYIYQQETGDTKWQEAACGDVPVRQFYCTRAACQIILSTTTLSKDAKGKSLKFYSHSYPNFLDKNRPGEETMSSLGRPFYLISHNKESHSQTPKPLVLFFNIINSNHS